MVDAFSVSWAGENNWLVHPIFRIPRVLDHLATLGERSGLPSLLAVDFYWRGLGPYYLRRF